MLGKELISVIIPLHNSQEHIKELIEMLEKQTLKNYEIIFVNDGSNDNTKAELEKLENKKNMIICNKENGGPSSARNYGLRWKSSIKLCKRSNAMGSSK